MVNTLSKLYILTNAVTKYSYNYTKFILVKIACASDKDGLNHWGILKFHKLCKKLIEANR